MPVAAFRSTGPGAHAAPGLNRRRPAAGRKPERPFLVDNLVDEIVDKPPSNGGAAVLALTASASERFPGGAKPIVEPPLGDSPADLPISRSGGCCSTCASQEGRPSMDQPTAAETTGPATDDGEPAAIDFVRFCYRRRRVGWPELYDEMCAVAGRGLYHGYSADDLGTIGVGLTLFEMPAMAAIAHRVVAEDQDRRRRSALAIRTAHAVLVEEAEGAETPVAESPAAEPVTVEVTATEQPPRLVPAAASA